MKCNKCEATLTESSFCNNCGVDVKMYKKLISASNALYNRGLEKAQVRDLSGARDDLRNSLKIYKKNIPARNLLGLVYFEMGDLVAAFSEWIVSKNYQPEDNIADFYIEEVQKNAGRLESYNTALKKYNQALLYAKQGNLDLAIIQLKKVLSLHEKFVSAHLLLALVAIETNQIELARKELEKVLNIDRGNVTALNYFKETDALRSKAADRKSSRISKDAVVYTSGNETIIQPKTASEGNARNVVLDILLGLVIGIAVCWFVLLPAKIQSANNTANQQVVEYSDQLEVKNATIIALEKEVQAAKEEAAAAKQQMTNTETKTSSYEALFEAQKLVAAKDYESAAEVLEGIDADSLSEGVRASYDAVSQQVNDVVLGVYYNRGVAQFNSKNYEEAKVLLEKVVTLNPQHDYAVYYLAKSYEQLNDVEQAKKYYEQLLQLLPESTRRAKTAKKFLDAHR